MERTVLKMWMAKIQTCLPDIKTVQYYLKAFKYVLQEWEGWEAL